MASGEFVFVVCLLLNALVSSTAQFTIGLPGTKPVASCERNNGGCEHTCRMESDEVVCGCHPGFTLADNKRNCVAQGFSEYYLGFFTNLDITYPNTVQFYVTTREMTSVPFTVNYGGLDYSYTAQPGTVTVVDLPKTIEVNEVTEANKGIHVLADDNKNIIVYGFSYYWDTSDGYLALPCISTPNSDSYVYYGVTADESFIRPTVMLIVGCEDGTEVQVTPSTTVTLPSQVGGSTVVSLAAGQTHTLTVNAQQTLLISALNTEITGSKVTSNKPISFFSGSVCSRFQEGACDIVIEQFPPTLSWGTTFLTVPIDSSRGMLYKIISAEDSNTVRIKCGISTPVSVSIDAGMVHALRTTDRDFCSIDADQPILVTEHNIGCCPGDPSMGMVTSVDQATNSYTVLADTSLSVYTHYIGITVLPTYYVPSKILIDEMPIANNWTTIYCFDGSVCGYGVVVNVSTGEHTITHDDPSGRISVVLFGDTDYGSYAYPAAGFQLINDIPVEIEMAEYNVTEGLSIEVCARALDTPDRNIPITFSSYSGTAKGGFDYKNINEMKEFTSVITRFCVEVETIDDNTFEDTENFYVQISTTDSSVSIRTGFALINLLPDADGERLDTYPLEGAVQGSTAVQVSGPQFSPTSKITCEFAYERNDIMVTGHYWSDSVAVCLSPILRFTGAHELRLSITEDGEEKFKQSSFFHALPFSRSAKINVAGNTALLFPGDTVTLTWNPSDVFPLTKDFNIDVAMFILLFQSWKCVTVLKTNISNNIGQIEVEIPQSIFLLPGANFVLFSISARLDLFENPSGACPATIGIIPNTPTIWSDALFISAVDINSQYCTEWADNFNDRKKDLEELQGLPPCPCTVSQARLPSSQLVEEKLSPLSFYFFHPNSSICFRQLSSLNATAQQCCYDSNGRLVTGVGGGSPYIASPSARDFSYSVAYASHFTKDIQPFIHCCKGKVKLCSKYYEYHPSDNCEGFDPPFPAFVYGDPHLVTLDGYKYTFNGNGEFTLAEATDGSLTIQGRMVAAAQADGTPAEATVFSAVVAKESSSDAVQFQLDEKGQGIETLVNGQLLRFGNASEIQLNNVTVISPRDNKTGALFACGAYIEAQAESGIISVLVVSLPDSFKNAVRGLMGNYNGDQSDDLQPKDGGSDPLPLDSSLETIHTQFGLTWIVETQEDSLFTYKEDKSFEELKNPDFKPVYEPKFTDSQLREEAEELCGDDAFCLFDVAATKRTDIGLSTLQGSQEFVEIVELSAPIVCDPPCQQGACVSNNSCNCQAGYTGTACDIPMYEDTCAVDICVNGGTCKELAGDTVCLCPPFYIGVTCSLLLPLELDCVSEVMGSIVSVDQCTANKPVRNFSCSLNGAEEPCNFPLKIDLAQLGVGYHLLQINATDYFNLTDTVNIDHTVHPLVLECESGVEGEVQRITGCTANNPLQQLLCSFDGNGSRLCTFPIVRNFTLSAPGSYQLKISAVDIYKLTAEVEINYKKPVLKVKFINSSPRIVPESRRVYFDFRVNRQVRSLQCHLTTDNEMDCSSEWVILEDVSPGFHVFRIVAQADNGDRVIVRRRFYMISDEEECAVNLINDGVSITGNRVTVQFLGLGSVDSYTCRLDSGNPYFCRSPARLQDLGPGQHKFVVTPEGSCGSGKKKLRYRFTV